MRRKKRERKPHWKAGFCRFGLLRQEPGLLTGKEKQNVVALCGSRRGFGVGSEIIRFSCQNAWAERNQCDRPQYPKRKSEKGGELEGHRSAVSAFLFQLKILFDNDTELS